MSTRAQLEQILAASESRLTAELHNRDANWTAARSYARAFWVLQDDLRALAATLTEGADQ